MADGPELTIVRALQLAFATKKLRSICEAAAIADDTFGVIQASHLRRTLADLDAAKRMTELPGTAVTFSGKKLANAAVKFSRRGFLVASQNHSKPPLLSSGIIQWSKVSRIKVLRIEVAR